MENIFILSGIIAVVFFIIKFLEMRFIEKETKPLKILFRDTIIVYISSILGFLLNITYLVYLTYWIYSHWNNLPINIHLT